MDDHYPPADLVRYVHDTRAAILVELLASVKTENNLLNDVRMYTVRDGLSERWVIKFTLNGTVHTLDVAPDPLGYSGAFSGEHVASLIADRVCTSIIHHLAKDLPCG